MDVYILIVLALVTLQWAGGAAWYVWDGETGPAAICVGALAAAVVALVFQAMELAG